MEQYDVLEQIGKGAFGSALLVRHKLEKKKYVLKKIRLARQTDRTRRSAHQEKELISKIRNPFIVEYKDSWVEKGCYVCIVIGYCEGGDMAQAIKKVNCIHFAEEKLCKWLVQLLMALDYLHMNHILHRDVKCSNIFLTKDQDIRLGCCIYEMAALRPAFKAFAAELLRHPHLQSHVLKINLKFGSPRRNTLPIYYDTPKKTRFLEPEEIPKLVDREKRRSSYSNDRTQNPSISEADPDSPYSMRQRQDFSTYINQKFDEMSVGSTQKEIGVDKPIIAKAPNVSKTPRLSTPVKGSNAYRRLSTPSKVSNNASNRTSLPMSHTQTPKYSRSTRRASLPMSNSNKKAAVTEDENQYKPNSGFLHDVESPDVSVNAPRIDKMTEYPLASSETPLYPLNRTSSTSAQCSSTSPNAADRSMMKDKCTVQTVDRALTKSNPVNEHSEHNQGSNVSSKSSSESKQQRFDTSSYQQRADALEGLLEFSARLLQQERYDELNVLLKPFGPEKVSPRETAIWLAKSIKETGA
ncbi:Serine/threonine-protein kinase Nek2 [Bienertia sinuspersici]